MIWRSNQMSRKHVQVFSGDPELVAHLAHYLHDPSCNILEEDGKFYLRSSYFETLPLLSLAAMQTGKNQGLGSVLSLISPAFDALSAPVKVEECISALLSILNGIIRLKYKNCGVLERGGGSESRSPKGVKPGSDYEINSSGQRAYSASKDITFRVRLTAGAPFYQTTSNQRPSTEKIWNIARSDAPVARVLHYYAELEDSVKLRKVVEEIMAETDADAATRKGKIRYPEWYAQNWAEPEIATIKIEEAVAFLHNPLLSGDQALHSEPFADTRQANKFLGTTMSLPEATEIVHALLMKWVTSKSK
jgi:hypothetical protein